MVLVLSGIPDDEAAAYAAAIEEDVKASMAAGLPLVLILKKGVELGTVRGGVQSIYVIRPTGGDVEVRIDMTTEAVTQRPAQACGA